MKKFLIFVIVALFFSCELAEQVYRKGGTIIMRLQITTMSYDTKIIYDGTKTVDERRIKGSDGKVRIEVALDGEYAIYYKNPGSASAWKVKYVTVEKGNYVELTLTLK